MAAEVALMPVSEDDRVARARRVVESSTGSSRTDFERGRLDGRRAAVRRLPVPALWGGAYAVGFLCGYSEVQLRHRTPVDDDAGPAASG
jgi:hypothetical protein